MAYAGNLSVYYIFNIVRDNISPVGKQTICLQRDLGHMRMLSFYDNSDIEVRIINVLKI